MNLGERQNIDLLFSFAIYAIILQSGVIRSRSIYLPTAFTDSCSSLIEGRVNSASSDLFSSVRYRPN